MERTCVVEMEAHISDMYRSTLNTVLLALPILFERGL